MFRLHSKGFKPKGNYDAGGKYSSSNLTKKNLGKTKVLPRKAQVCCK